MRYATPILLAMLALAARAEKAPMSVAALKEVSTDVVVGEVKAIYARASREGNWKYTRYVAELKVTAVEKGEGAPVGELVYVRYWRRGWAGPGAPPPSTSGHSGLPEEGQSLRVYLARNAYDGFTQENKDGGFNVIGANGFERLKKPN